MRNTARTTSIPATFRQSGAPVTPPATECGARRPGWDQGPAVGSHRIPCILPAGHDGQHRDGLGNTWSPAVESTPAELYALWQGMTIGETAATPLPKLLALLGVTFEEVEPEELPIGIHATFHGQIGDAEIKLSRSLPQVEREPIVREFLNTITPDVAHRRKGPNQYRVTKQITGTVQCYDWCSEAHHEHTGNIEDIVHQSARITLELPTENGPMAVLYAQIAVDQFSTSEVQRKPHIVIDDDQSLYFLPLMQSVEFSDELFEFATALREMTSKAAGK